MNDYHIILEEVLTPDINRKYMYELRKRGWIHTNVPIKRKNDDIYYLAITCTPELLGKVVAFLLDKVGWLIVEQKSDKIINTKDCRDFQTVIPF